MQRQNQRKKRQGEHKEAKKTILKATTLREIFADRKNVFLGLTKSETLSLYYKINLSTILNWDEKKVKQKWQEIKYIKKYLKDKEIIGIIAKQMNRGFVLRGNIFGERQLENKSHVYFNCTRDDDAWEFRNSQDKIGNGFYKSGEHVTNIAQQKPIMKIINQPAQQRAGS